MTASSLILRLVSSDHTYNMCIVDEADFIMVDEARIPLVIARQTETPETDPKTKDRCVRELEHNRDFIIDRNHRRCYLTMDGEGRVQQILGCGGIHQEDSYPYFAAVNVGLQAHHLLTLDLDYIVNGDKIELVDEFTGRIADRRRWG